MAACLIQAGHECEVFVLPFENNVQQSLSTYSPDIIGAYCVTGNIYWAIDLTAEYKRDNPNTLFIVGGPHPTYHPDIINNEVVDAVCVGEGEEVIVEVADKYDGQSLLSLSGIRNLHLQIDNEIQMNPLRHLEEYLDSLPLANRIIYDKYPYFRNIETLSMIATRGCPFNCTYCYSHASKKLYKGLGNFVRMRSPIKVGEEIDSLKKNYKHLKYIYFVDSTLNLNNKWFLELMDYYAEHIRIPFFCHLRYDVTTDEQIQALKNAKCRNVAVGIEGGSFRLRKEMLNRNISDELIIDISRKLKEAGIIICTANIFGLPTETLEESRMLIKINQVVKPDAIASTIFQPYPGTKLGKFVIDNNMAEKFDFEDMPNYYHHSILNQKDIRMQERLQKLLYYYVKYQKLTWFWNFMAKYAPFSLLVYMFYFGLTASVKTQNGFSWFGIMKYAILNYSYYSKKN